MQRRFTAEGEDDEKNATSLNLLDLVKSTDTASIYLKEKVAKVVEKR